ncbi:glycerophosphodiester phosphodiesterase [Polyangium aurulentum]|uniref:glycerophosphodiester phosphodiesterase n=1 Tax=Polyangium aurulentum TaxID=2567896 RepID=UPI0010AEDD30|nr:glycerophosphodiester phosphodiesterase [Polyangium aurulentum]UQA59336.1 glycerophosphodiester phosphodiesterase [Polyangium aurulentum]
MRFFDGPRPRLFAHRGASGTMPESTLPAFTAALAAGADRLELDVHASADGEVVVFHDDTLDRTTSGAGPVARLRLEEIRALDAGYHLMAPDGSRPFRGRGYRVPTFAEVLEAFPDVPLNIEIKVDDVGLVDAVRRLLERFGAMERVLLAAESGALMEKIRARIPGVVTGMSLPEVLEFMGSAGLPAYRPRGTALQVPVSYAGVPIVTRHFVEAARAAGVEVHVWVINDEAEMDALLDLGVDGIMTDFPELGARVLARRGCRR